MFEANFLAFASKAIHAKNGPQHRWVSIISLVKKSLVKLQNNCSKSWLQNWNQKEMEERTPVRVVLFASFVGGNLLSVSFLACRQRRYEIEAS